MTKKSVYMKHIRRLELEKALLTEMLIEERRLRVTAYQWYRKRLMSRWLSLMEMLWMSYRDK